MCLDLIVVAEHLR